MKVIVRARYKGAADEIGYEPGKEYALTVATGIFPLYFAVYVQDYTTRDKSCPYASFRTFLRNWENVTLIKEF